MWQEEVTQEVPLEDMSMDAEACEACEAFEDVSLDIRAYDTHQYILGF